MRNTLSQILVIAITLVTFVGQAMAYSTALPCDTSVETHAAVDSESVGENANPEQHEDSEHIDTDCCDSECCDVDCICPSKACSPLVYLNSGNQSIPVALVAVSVFLGLSEQPESITTLRYRPPILTS